MKWSQDHHYFGRDDIVDAYDRGEEVVWENVLDDTPEVVVVNPAMRQRIDAILDKEPDEH